MRGLIQKELYSILILYKKNILLVLGMYTALGLVGGMAFIGNILIWMAGFYVLGSISVDQYSGWERYARTLPVSDRQMVGSRMVTNLLVQFLAGIYAAALTAVVALKNGGPMLEELVSVALIFLVAVISMGLMIPSAFKWGVERARITFSLLFAAMFVVLYAVLEKVDLDVLLGDVQPDMSWLMTAAAVAAVIYWLGYEAACRIYQKKEF